MHYVFIPIAIFALGFSFALGILIQARSATQRAGLFLLLGRRAGYKHAHSVISECSSLEEAKEIVKNMYTNTFSEGQE